MVEHFIPAPTGMGKKEAAPGAVASLVLGIVSLANLGFFGFVPAIIGMVLGRKAFKAIEEMPGNYSENSRKMANAGYKMSLFGLIFGIPATLITIFYYYFLFKNDIY